MAKIKVIWSKESAEDMFEIMDYYAKRNKSKTYSTKLYKEIKQILNTLDFSITLPQKTSDEKLFYFTHNHIFIGFEIKENDLIVHLAIDE